jgi:hypothetical protein
MLKEYFEDDRYYFPYVKMEYCISWKWKKEHLYKTFINIGRLINYVNNPNKHE